MESPFKDIDYERENEISKCSYNRGYVQGYQDASLKLAAYLCSLSEEKLIEWYKSYKAMIATNDSK